MEEPVGIADERFFQGSLCAEKYMASCLKCGKGNIKKRKGRPKKCKYCGILTGER